MINFQTLNQLYLTILALFLTSLFVGTLSLSTPVGERGSDKFWRWSVGTRALAYFLWAALPIVGPLAAVGANMLFVFSAGSLALLFRSWRRNVSGEAIAIVFLSSLLVGGMHLLLQHAEGSYASRLIVTGIGSMVFSVWELIELRSLSRRDPERHLKLIMGVVMVQMLISLVMAIATFHYASNTQRYLTDNVTKSVYFTWCVLGIHLIVYLVIGSYLYRKALLNQRSAVSEKDSLSALLDERERLLSSLIAANRVASSGALSASLAHEISQPLTASLMQLGLMRRIVEKREGAEPVLAGLLKNALQDISRSKQVLENMRAIFRQSPRNMRNCDLDPLVSQTVMILQRRVQESNVRLVYTPGRSIVTEIADLEIQQVLINLLNNAIDALELRQDSVRNIWIDLAETADWAIVSVCDNGSGVKPALVDTMFDLASTGKNGGMGIGLWISKHIVEERHHGRLWLDTHYTAGARFVMELPKHPAAQPIPA